MNLHASFSSNLKDFYKFEIEKLCLSHNMVKQFAIIIMFHNQKDTFISFNNLKEKGQCSKEMNILHHIIKLYDYVLFFLKSLFLF